MDGSPGKNETVLIGKGNVYLFSAGSLDLDKYLPTSVPILEGGMIEDGRLDFGILLSDQCLFQNFDLDAVTVSTSSDKLPDISDAILSSLDISNQIVADNQIDIPTVAMMTSEYNSNLEKKEEIRETTNTNEISDNSKLPHEMDLYNSSNNSVDFQSNPLRSPKQFRSPKSSVRSYSSTPDQSDSDCDMNSISSKRFCFDSDDDSTVNTSVNTTVYTRSTVDTPYTHANYINVFIRMAPSKVKMEGTKKGCESCDNGYCIKVTGTKQLKLLTPLNCDCQSFSSQKIKRGVLPLVPHSDKVFKFDRIFSENSTQQEIFESIQKNLNYVLDGYNSTIFTYGPTSTGKTYTMNGDNENPGIIPRTIVSLFQLKEKLQNSNIDESITLEMSYIELCNNTFRNLIKSTPSDYSANLMDDFSKGSEKEELSMMKRSASSKLLMTFGHDNKIELHEDKSGEQIFTGPLGRVNIKLPIYSESEAFRYINEGFRTKGMSKRTLEEEYAR